MKAARCVTHCRVLSLLLGAFVLVGVEFQAACGASCAEESGAICNAILKFPKEEEEEEGLVVDQGAYCTCKTSDCSSVWENETLSNVSAFTWYYYAQANMEVQYKFCEPQAPIERVCSSNVAVAATIVSNVTVWNPRKLSHECRCPQSKYYLKNWRIHMTHEWLYQYVCEMKQCEVGQVCAHQHFNLKLNTTGFDMMCVCPRHYSCEVELEANTTDNSLFDYARGEHYFQRYCYSMAARRAQRYEYLKAGKDADTPPSVTASPRTVRRAELEETPTDYAEIDEDEIL